MLSKVKSAFFLFSVSIGYFICPITGLYYLINGCFSLKLILGLFLIYQYFFCVESSTFKKIVAWGAPVNFFDNYHLIFDGEDDDFFSKSPSKTLLCYHPHGVMVFGITLLTYQYKYFNSFVKLSSRAALLIPFGGILLILGGIDSINPGNVNKLMKNGRNILMVPGGFEEATITNYDENRVYLKERKGFIKYGLKYGYTIHPCFGFNENRTYYYFTSIKLGIWLNKLKIPGVLFISKFLNILPNNDVTLAMVIGKGIKLPIIEKPEKKDINNFHRIYLEALKELYDRYNGKFGKALTLKVY